MNRIHLLDIARGLAALSVVIFHYRIFYFIDNEKFIISNQPFSSFLYLIYDYGWIAVQFFFLLSGFVFFKFYLKKIKEKKISFYNFFILRFSRLYPLHFFTLLIVLLFYYLNVMYDFHSYIYADLKHFILNLFLIHEWGFKSIDGTFNDPSWSISVEILMYIVFFVIALKTNIFLSSSVILILSSILYFESKWIGYGGYCFFVGGLSYLINQKINIKIKLKMITLSIVIFSFSLFLKLVDFNSVIDKIILLTVIFPSIINLLNLINECYPKLGSKFSFLGDISYSMYLIHFPLILFFRFISDLFEFSINLDFNYIFIFYIFSTMFFSLAIYRYLEIPLRIIIRQRLIKS